MSIEKRSSVESVEKLRAELIRGLQEIKKEKGLELSYNEEDFSEIQISLDKFRELPPGLVDDSTLGEIYRSDAAAGVLEIELPHSEIKIFSPDLVVIHKMIEEHLGYEFPIDHNFYRFMEQEEVVEKLEETKKLIEDGLKALQKK